MLIEKRSRRTGAVLLLSLGLVGGGLVGCGSKEEEPVVYKGQPGDKMPGPKKGMSGGPANGGGGAAAGQTAPGQAPN